VSLRAVTFDFWNTLIRADDAGVRDRRLTAWLGLLAGEGLELDGETLGGAMGHAGSRFDASWRQNRFYGASHAVDDVLDHLGIEVAPATRDAMVSAIVDPDPALTPSPTPNVGAALEALRSRGIRLGIICDVGLAPSTTLRRYLRHHGLLDHFDHVSFSDEVGTFKPDARIFHHALGGLGGVDPGEAAHVGDLRRTDIAGAQALGIFAVRYAGIFDDPGSVDDGTHEVSGDAVIADHADLLDALGLS
jgi:putative hydrolase of the HAD superfamily